jgi:adenylate cyclase
MAKEIEHKYLVVNDDYKKQSTESYEIIQAYLDRSTMHTIRIRKKGNKCFLTIKGETNVDSRLEFEYQIPEADFTSLLNLCDGTVIAKTRYIVPFEGHIWEVDEFHGSLSPLVIAEIELPYSNHNYGLPSFVGADVTGDARYYNSNL